MKRATCSGRCAFPILSISIHALVKRATEISVKGSVKLAISIHALVKRATFAKALTGLTLTISIHALVKRATG